MTLVNIDLRNQGYETGPDDRVIFYSLLVREGDFGTISTAPVEVELVDGKATVELAPGPVGVQILAGQVADTRVKIGEVPPTGPTTLNAVMMVTPAYTPALQAMMIAAIEHVRDEALGQVSGAVAAEIGNTTHVIATSTAVHANKIVRLDANGKLAIGAGAVTGPTDPVNKTYVDGAVSAKANTAHQHNGADIVSGTTQYVGYSVDERYANQLVRLDANGKLYVDTAGITTATDPTNKAYVDTEISTAVSNATAANGTKTTLWWN